MDTEYSVYKYNEHTENYDFLGDYTLKQLEQCGISEAIRIGKTIDSVQKYITK